MTLTVDDLSPGDRVRFHDISVGADYEGVFVKKVGSTIRDGVGLRLRDWRVVATNGRPVDFFPLMTVDGLWHVKNLTDITKVIEE